VKSEYFYEEAIVKPATEFCQLWNSFLYFPGYSLFENAEDVSKKSLLSILYLKSQLD